MEPVDKPAAEWISFGPYLLFPTRRSLERDGTPVHIGDKALDLLLTLIETPGNILTKTELAERVWRREWIEDVNLRVAVGSLRKLLGPTPDGGEYVVNVVGRGYAFSTAVAVESWPGARVESRPMRVRAESTAAGRLPPLLNPVIGRQREIRMITDLLAVHRLMTLVGPGGIGKTTVAIACASQRAELEDGVCFVDFGPIRDPALVSARIAEGLGAEQTVADPFDYIVGHLAPRRQLLILDNCEHVADAAAAICEDILRHAPRVKIIATSREPLRIAAEVIVRLEGLRYPEDGGELTVEEVMSFAAVQLFVDRVQAVSPEFVLTESLAPVAAEICRRVDGIALAIQLAAGRVPAFGVIGVAARLSDQFRLLSQGQRTALPRHQTLEATFDWSFELLSTAEKALLARIAVFAQTFTVEGAAEIAGWPPIAPAEVASIIGDLVSKSLVIFIGDADGSTYRLLETARVFAQARLAAAGEGREMTERHARFVVGRCKAFHQAAVRANDNAATRIAKDVLDDLRSILERSIQTTDRTVATETMRAAIPLLMHLGLAYEVSAWIERILAIETDQPDCLALMLSLGGAFHLSVAQTSAQVKLYSDAYALACELDDVTGQLQATWGLMVTAWSARQPRESLAAAERFHAVATRSGRPEDAIMSRCMIAASQFALGEFAVAEDHLRFVLAHYPPERRAVDIQQYLFDHRAVALRFLAWIEWLSGRVADGLATAERAIAEAGDHLPSLFLVLTHCSGPIAIEGAHWEMAARYIDQLYRRCGHHPRWRLWADTLNDILAIHADRSQAALQRLDAFLGEGEGFQLLTHHPWYFLQLVKGHMAFGHRERARALLGRLLAHGEGARDGWLGAELTALEACLASDHDAQRACAGYQQAIRIARGQGAALIELGAAVGLLRCARGGIGRRDAKALVHDAFSRMSEQLGEAGDGEARSLLRQQFRRVISL
jgi:predicted ATPase/DNA-binding winged helix-turn-helix (wHTH) protein